MGFPTWFKVLFGIVAILAVLWIGSIVYVIVTVASDPEGIAQTVGSVAGSVVKGYEKTVNEE